MNNYFKTYIQHAMLILPLAFMTSCTDDILDNTVAADDFQGEKVLFTVGTTDNVLSRAGEAKTYYMPDKSRFVCRMYYKAKSGSNVFDISGKSDQTAWLKVSGNIGNSLYWNSNYNPVSNVVGKGGVDEYGNDASAPAFYWQNRKEHAFVAWTDLNKANTIKGGSAEGALNFMPTGVYTKYTGQKEKKFVVTNYEISGVSEKFTSLAKMEEYVQRASGSTTIGETQEFKDKQAAIESQNDWSTTGVADSYHYRHGWQYKYSEYYATTTYDAATEADATAYDKGWVRYMMYFAKIDYTPTGEEKQVKNENQVVTFLKNLEGKYVAAAEAKTNESGEYLDAEGNVTDDVASFVYDYYVTDEDGNIRYDETKPKYTFYYKEHAEKKDVDIVEAEYPALVFDLTRGTKQSMAEQPDIVRAKEIQAPTGSTQESNRVNLYFKHQFSQVQVNLKNAADNSVMIESGDIKNVELLGVTKHGYVFVDMDENGSVLPATYEQINFSEFSEAQILDNPFGTSLQMFNNNDVPNGYLRSFNAITFGQLQAIRITWEESDSHIVHKSTFRLDDTNLINLQSGVRYVWNMEIRRGTLAVIRAEILDWELPEEEEYNGNAEGTIQY